MLLDNELLKLLDKLELMGKANYFTNFTGERISPQPGPGLDFKDYRHYQIGDDFRYIDWNLYSRLEKLFLKVFIEEKGLDLYFLVDRSNSMSFGSPPKFSFAQKITAALGYVGLASLDKIEGLFFNNELDFKGGKVTGKAHVNRFFNIISSYTSEGETDLEGCLKKFVLRYEKPGLVVIISDFFDSGDIFAGLKTLKVNRWQIVLIQILAEEEVNPSVESNYRFIDSETGNKMDVFIDDETIITYKELLEEFNNKLIHFSNKYRIDFYQLKSSVELEEAVLSLLTKRRGLK